MLMRKATAEEQGPEVIVGLPSGLAMVHVHDELGDGIAHPCDPANQPFRVFATVAVWAGAVVATNHAIKVLGKAFDVSGWLIARAAVAARSDQAI
jgi:hypothetical protein